MITGIHKRVIRLFISSTFSDFRNERDLLAENVYNELRELCESREFSFHPIDLRWGVSKEDSILNHAVQICIDEIDRCKSLSPYVNFLIMAGDRYGWQPLPEKLSPAAWERLTRGLDPDSVRVRLMNLYYKQDLNDAGREYCLLPRPDIQRELTGSVYKMSDEFMRQSLYETLNEQDPVRGAEPTGFDPLLWQFSASATEQEIYHGYLWDKSSARYNTFILLKTDGSTDDSEPAAILRKKLDENVDADHRVQLYIKNIPPKGPESSGGPGLPEDNSWIDSAREFLKNVITEQIEQYESLEPDELDRAILDETYQFVRENYVALPSASEAEAFIRIRTGHILLTGGSGSGKSWFLKNYADRIKDQCSVAAVFNDVQPRGHSYLQALEMLVGALREAGLLEGEVPASSKDDDPAGWFESALKGLKQSSKRTVIILDSVNRQNMPDYISSPGKSLFGIELPPNVTMIVSAVSDDDLRECDRDAVSQRFELRKLAPREGMYRLYSVLEKHGRTLTDTQRTAAEACLQNSPELDCALAIEIMAQIGMKLRSWDPFPDALRGSIRFHELVSHALFHPDRDDYVVLRRHTLGYIALSSVGLTESELLDLLSEDHDVREEVWQQSQKTNSIGTLGDKLPTVLWAVQYAELKPFLTDINDNGSPLLQVRHTRLREEICRELDKTDIQQTLLTRMIRYFGRQKWLLNTKKTTPDGRIIVIPNRRKVQEYLPLFEKKDDVKSLAHQLSDPLCVDAYVRCEQISEIKSYLSGFSTHIISVKMLLLLRQKDLLFRLFPDSYIPAAVQSLYPDDGSDDSRSIRGSLLRDSGNSFYIRSIDDRSASSGSFFPQLRGRCEYALHANGRDAAVLTNGVIYILDLNNREFTPAFCPSVRDEGFLYWKDDSSLIVRCAKKRLYYTYSQGQLFPRRINQRSSEGNIERCPDWGNLLHENTRSRAGGWIEAEHFGSGLPDPTCIRYRIGDQQCVQQIYEKYEYSITAKTYETYAALVIDGERLIVSELTNRKIIYEAAFPGITTVEWSNNGKKLLVVVRGNTLMTVDPFGAAAKDMNKPQSETPALQGIKDVIRYMRDGARLMDSFAATDPNAYCASDGPSDTTALFGAISVNSALAAVYRYTKKGPILSLYNFADCSRQSFSLTDDDIMQKKENVCEIMFDDCYDDPYPFHMAVDRRGFVWRSRGDWMIFDLSHDRKPASAPSSAIPSEKLTESMRRLRDAYASDVTKKLRLRISQTPDKFSRRKGTDHIYEYLSYRRLHCADVLKTSGFYWLVDKENGIVNLYGRNGDLLCSEQTDSRILAADIKDDRLFLLLETNQVIALTPSL